MTANSADALMSAAVKAMEPDERYPYVYHDRNNWRRVGIGLAVGTDFIRLDTLLEDKPGGAWWPVEFTPDEAEQLARRLLERARTARQALADHDGGMREEEEAMLQASIALREAIQYLPSDFPDSCDYDVSLSAAHWRVLAGRGLTECGLHPKTADLVKRFAEALAAKLLRAEQKYGYSDGWSQDDWQAECVRHLHEHVAKGDPLDVAAYAAFCWAHGWSTAAPTTPTTKHTMTLTLTDAEMAAVEKLAEEQALRPPLIFRQALRVYQLYSLPEGHPERIVRRPRTDFAFPTTPSAASGDRPAGHCNDEDAWAQFSKRYGKMDRAELSGGHMTDFEAANHVYMVDRTSLDLLGAQTVAKDRIRWLSVQLARALLAHQPGGEG